MSIHKFTLIESLFYICLSPRLQASEPVGSLIKVHRFECDVVLFWFDQMYYSTALCIS